MKIKTLFFTLFFLAASGFAFANENIYDNDKGDEGGNNTGVIRSSKYPGTPIRIAVTTGNGVDVAFIADLGNVTATIKNNLGAVVYKKTFNTSFVETTFINTSGLSAGAYAITFTDSDGIVIKTESFLNN